MNIEEQMKALDSKIAEANEVLNAAVESSNPLFIKKAQAALLQFVEQKKELLESFSLGQQNTIPEGFKLNIQVGKAAAEAKPMFAKETGDDLPPHLKR